MTRFRSATTVVCATVLAVLVCACSSQQQTPAAPAAPPTNTPLPTPTPVLRLFALPNTSIEVGCGAFCAWTYSVDLLTRTNDPLMARVGLSAGEGFVLVRVTVDARRAGKNVEIAPDEDFRLSTDAGEVQAVPPEQLGIADGLAGTIPKGDIRTGSIVFRLRETAHLTQLVFRDEISLDSDTAASVI